MLPLKMYSYSRPRPVFLGSHLSPLTRGWGARRPPRAHHFPLGWGRPPQAPACKFRPPREPFRRRPPTLGCRTAATSAPEPTGRQGGGKRRRWRSPTERFPPPGGVPPGPRWAPAAAANFDRAPREDPVARPGQTTAAAAVPSALRHPPAAPCSTPVPPRHRPAAGTHLPSPPSRARSGCGGARRARPK